MIYKSKTLELMDLSSTDYLFLPFDVDALDAYLETDEWRGKAGACMVEGFANRILKKS